MHIEGIVVKKVVVREHDQLVTLYTQNEGKLVAIAKDVQPAEVVMHIPMLAEEKGIYCVQVPSKEELGAAAGIELGTSAVVIVQEGEAKDLLKDIFFSNYYKITDSHYRTKRY